MNQLLISHFPELEYSCNEAINTLCTNLFYCGDNIQTVLFTSRYAQEGKSGISMNVMRTLASFGKRVVLVDTDLRRSNLARRYRFSYINQKSPGLAQFLAGMCSLGEVVYETNIPNAFIIPAGRQVVSSLRLLSSLRFGEMMQKLRAEFDVIVVDSPPAGVIVDAIEIAKHCDGAIIVVAHNLGSKKELGQVVANVNRTGCRVLGAVMNGVNFGSVLNRKYYYRSGPYSSYYTYNNEASGGNNSSDEKKGREK